MWNLEIISMCPAKNKISGSFLLGLMGYGSSVCAHDGIHALRTIFHVILPLGDAISDHLEGQVQPPEQPQWPPSGLTPTRTCALWTGSERTFQMH